MPLSTTSSPPMHRSPTTLPLLAGTIKPADCTLTATHSVPNSHLFVLLFACLYLYDTLALPPLDYSVVCFTAPKPEPSRSCLYVCMSMIERGKIREQPRVLPTRSQNAVNNRRLRVVRMVARLSQSEENVPRCHLQSDFPRISKVRYATLRPEVSPFWL